MKKQMKPKQENTYLQTDITHQLQFTIYCSNDIFAKVVKALQTLQNTTRITSNQSIQTQFVNFNLSPSIEANPPSVKRMTQHQQRKDKLLV